MNLPGDADIGPASDPHRRGGPFADTIHGEDHSLVERRGIEGAGGVTQMMFREQQALGREAIVQTAQFPAEEVALEQLFPNPQGHCHAKRADSAGSECQIGFQQPFKLQERFIVEDHAIDAGEAGAGLPQAEVDGMPRKTGVVFLSGEALLLSRRHDFAIGDQGRRTIVVERRYSQDFHEGETRAPSGPLRRSCR